MISCKLSLCILGLAASLLVSAEARLPTEGILGGDVAGANQFPYQVALQHDWEWSNDLIWCGGAIIGERFVLTAAHCVVQQDGQFDTQRLLVVVGTSDLARASNARRVEVAKVYVPTGYQPQFNITFDDIALLRLNEPLGLQQHRNLRALMLPWDTRITYAGEEVEVSGFGYDWMEVVNGEENGGQSDTKLRFAEAKVLTNAECQRKYARAQHIYDEQICARTRQPWDLTPTGVCAGDSGGPLVHRGKTIVGVVSKSPFGCKEISQPAIYTRVSSYMDFIRNAIRDKQTSDIRTFELIRTPRYTARRPYADVNETK